MTIPITIHLVGLDFIPPYLLDMDTVPGMRHHISGVLLVWHSQGVGEGDILTHLHSVHIPDSTIHFILLTDMDMEVDMDMDSVRGTVMVMDPPTVLVMDMDPPTVQVMDMV